MSSFADEFGFAYRIDDEPPVSWWKRPVIWIADHIKAAKCRRQRRRRIAATVTRLEALRLLTEGQ